MPLILALETTSEVCSVAIGRPNELVQESCESGRKHNKLVLEMIDSACQSLGIERKNIDCVAFSAGPGSFTGVRIGASLAQGIATGVAAKISRVPTSLAMAERVSVLLDSPCEFWVRRISRGSLFYDAKFRYDGQHCVIEKADSLVDADEVQRYESVYSCNDLALSAEDVLTIAAEDVTKWEEPSKALPIYVDGDHPWRPQK